MIRFRLAELIADFQFKHGRRVTLKDLSEATGINRNTLSRMANTRGYSTSTDTLDKLCKFFGCDVGDVAGYMDDAAVVPMPLTASAPAMSDAATADVASVTAAKKTVRDRTGAATGSGKAQRKGTLPR